MCCSFFFPNDFKTGGRALKSEPLIVRTSMHLLIFFPLVFKLIYIEDVADEYEDGSRPRNRQLSRNRPRWGRQNNHANMPLRYE